MRIRVTAFARIREILGPAHLERTVEPGASVATVWSSLAAEYPALVALRASTRFACNAVFVDDAHPLGEGDELALLPPFGGG